MGQKADTFSLEPEEVDANKGFVTSDRPFGQINLASSLPLCQGEVMPCSLLIPEEVKEPRVAPVMTAGGPDLELCSLHEGLHMYLLTEVS